MIYGINIVIIKKLNIDNNNGLSVILMLSSVIIYSFLPLFVYFGETWEYPFYFNAGYQLSAALFIAFRIIGKARTSKITIFSYIKYLYDFRSDIVMCLLILVCIVSGVLAFPSYSLSIQHINAAISAVALEISQIITVLLLAVFFAHSNRYKKIKTSDIVLMLFAFIGLYFVVFSQENEATNYITGDYLIGALLIIFAAMIVGLPTPISIKFGNLMSNKISEIEKGKKNILNKHDMLEIEYVCLLISVFVSRLLSGIVSIFIALYLGESSFYSAILWGSSSGLLIAGLGAVLGYRALQITSNTSINTIRYAIPIIAIGWLFVFSVPFDFDLGYFIIGSIIIIASNILINLPASINLASKSIIIISWIFGAFVYLTPDDYFEINLSAMIFIMLIGTWIFLQVYLFFRKNKNSMIKTIPPCNILRTTVVLIVPLFLIFFDLSQIDREFGAKILTFLSLNIFMFLVFDIFNSKNQYNIIDSNLKLPKQKGLLYSFDICSLLIFLSYLFFLYFKFQ